MRTWIAMVMLAGSLAGQSSDRTQAVDRTQVPETPPLAPYKLPAVFETKLSNGLSIMLVEDRRFPLVTVRLAFRAGSRFDPANQFGLSETVASLLKEGTASRSARQIAEELAMIGGELGASAGSDNLTISGSALEESTGKLLDLVADISRNSTFPQEEIDLRKQNRLQELELQLSQSSTLADEQLRKAVFGSHPYARTIPSAAAIESVKREDLVGYRDRLLVPGNAVLIAVGAIPARKQMPDLIHARFGAWPAKPVPAAPAAEIPKPHRTITLVDRPGSAQIDVNVGKVSVDRNQPDHFPLVVGATILGGGASSRMFNNIREKQGFAYHASAHHMPMKEAGMFVAETQVREEVLEPAIKAVLAELDGMAKGPVSAEELTSVKNYLNGTFVMSIANQGGLASQLASLKMNGVPNDYLEKYITRVRSVEPDQIQKVAAKYIASGDAAIVVVGDASKIQKTVEKFGTVRVQKAQ